MKNNNFNNHNYFKKIIITFLFLIILSLSQVNSWRYDKQKNSFFYTIDFPDYPEKWKIIDDSKNFNAYFQNESHKAFIEVNVYDLSSGEINQDVVDIFIKRFNMDGSSKNTTFCKYKAIRGIYDFNYNGSDLRMDMVVFKDNYFYYVVMGYSYTNDFDKYKKDLEDIMYSCKIYYDNNIVYGNDTNEKPEAAQYSDNKKKELDNNNKNEDKGVYTVHIKWDKYKEYFQFLKSDMEKAKKEMADIGEFEGNVWKGWEYFNIDTNSDTDYNFTFWKMFYQEMFNKNINRVNNVYQYFNNLSKTKKISSFDLAKTIMQCIQSIPYERPRNIVKVNTGENILDFFPPNEIAFYKKGDCDTKSLFMVILLRRLGFDAVMYHSEAYGHAMVGLNINASGKYKIYNGIKYFFIESTYTGWNIGDLPPQMNDVNKWRLIPIK